MTVYPVVLSQSKFIHRDNLSYPFEERGLQFGDGVYEVIRVYRGTYHLLKEHVDRLFRSAEAIKLALPFTNEQLIASLLELLKRNDMKTDGKVYLQATRGSAPRDHVFPKGVVANVYAYVQNLDRNLVNLQQGVSVLTHEDIRWEYCFIKSLNLLPNVLAKQTAKEKNCYEAILHKDGKVTECSSSNVYLVKDGTIYTHPTTKQILHGCVRMAVERFAKDLDIPFVEEAFMLDDIQDADELFLTSTTSEVLPIITVDGETIRDGKPGSITRRLQKAYEMDANIS
ncbi:D-amino-acid transaminase [Virgibacillus soli]|uniref:D-alanine aminotransferase n=1 Tax=Paracerasibacillus soli TaxID=480284 RepID=A0ABU5CPF1_9BACI|nr:D-amino-acid transaminase [Virgibacillus soli]MDY0407771.1 D-amino-acid transaminase [Virgibacillus soli]